MSADWVKPHDVYLGLASAPQERLDAYRALFVTAINNADLTHIRDSTHKGWALGGEPFKVLIQARSGRQSDSKGMGRPRLVRAQE